MKKSVIFFAIIILIVVLCACKANPTSYQVGDDWKIIEEKIQTEIIAFDPFFDREQDNVQEQYENYCETKKENNFRLSNYLYVLSTQAAIFEENGNIIILRKLDEKISSVVVYDGESGELLYKKGVDLISYEEFLEKPVSNNEMKVIDSGYFDYENSKNGAFLETHAMNYKFGYFTDQAKVIVYHIGFGTGNTELPESYEDERSRIYIYDLITHEEKHLSACY